MTEDDVAELITPQEPSAAVAEAVSTEKVVPAAEPTSTVPTAPIGSEKPQPTTVGEPSEQQQLRDALRAEPRHETPPASVPVEMTQSEVAAEAPADSQPIQADTDQLTVPPAVADLAAPAEAAPTPGLVPGGPLEEEPGPDPGITGPRVSFEPAAGTVATPAESDVSDTGPPRGVADMMDAPPPPPLDPSIGEFEDIAAAKSSTEAPPAAAAHAAAPDIVDAELVEPSTDDGDTQHDPFGASQRDDMEMPAAEPAEAKSTSATSIGEEIAAAAAKDQPAVIIPRTEDDDAEVRRDLPQPIGLPVAQRAIPRPIDQEADVLETPADRARQSDAELEADEDDLPPLDGRFFRNPGYLGQALQLGLIITAGLAVAMILANIVLNNRLDAYATTGESVARVDSAVGIINSWLRPLLIAAVLAVYALTAMWSRRVVDNLAVFDNKVEETALWMWIVPGVNMWVLFRHFDLAWKGSEYYARGSREWTRGRPDWWTLAFVGLSTLGFLVVIYASLLGAETFESAIDANAFSIVGYALLAFGLLSGVRAIANVTERQRIRVDGLG